MSLLRRIYDSPRLFNIVSWGLTALIVIALLATTLGQIITASAGPEPTATPDSDSQPTPASPPDGADGSAPALVRQVTLKTAIDAIVSYEVSEYRVKSGDSIFGIAKDHNITPETLLWANFDTLEDDPHSIRAGQVLRIPPVDGIYYQWEEGDTLETVADEFGSTPDDILGFPGNDIDLTDPTIAAGTYVMIPGGAREFFQWLIPDVAVGASGTARVSGAGCAGGPIGGGGFIWPTANHYLSGNDYWSGHLGIDIAAVTGVPIWAADAGVVTMAQGGWNYGYGNVVMIDHGNGFITLYAHMSQISVVPCQGVAAGTVVGLSGATGNAFGAHLHFEVRQNGGFISPWYVLPPP
jgi:murein DD-endopeptidase MepM/ murein hydrolase activator NlpD